MRRQFEVYEDNKTIEQAYDLLKYENAILRHQVEQLQAELQTHESTTHTYAELLEKQQQIIDLQNATWAATKS